MWTRRKEEEPAPRPSSGPPTSVDLTREGIPMFTAPTRVSEPSGGNAASVGKSMVVKGQIYSREDLYVDGEVEGTIEVQEHCLTVGPNGRVQASVKARNVIVHGTIHGNMDVGEKIDVRKDAKVVGDLKMARISIQDGAYFKGSVDVVKKEVTRTAQSVPSQAAKAAAAPQTEAPAAATGAAVKKS